MWNAQARYKKQFVKAIYNSAAGKFMDKKISRKFFNDKASTWDQSIRNNDPLQLTALAKRLQIKPNSWILDVGTGTGVFIPYIKNSMNGSGRIICVDYAINMLHQAQKKKLSSDIAFICSEIETLHLFSNTFDTVVCYSTFPHFHDKLSALGNIHRMMKLGADLYICHTASSQTINAIHRSIPDFSDHLIPDQGQMEKLLQAVGFIEVAVCDTDNSYLATAMK